MITFYDLINYLQKVTWCHDAIIWVLLLLFHYIYKKQLTVSLKSNLVKHLGKNLSKKESYHCIEFITPPPPLHHPRPQTLFSVYNLILNIFRKVSTALPVDLWQWVISLKLWLNPYKMRINNFNKNHYNDMKLGTIALCLIMVIRTIVIRNLATIVSFEIN